MMKDIDFLQDIVRSYQQPDCVESLTAFFKQADRLETDSQFACFMNECLKYRNELERLSVLQDFLNVDSYKIQNKDKIRASHENLQSLLDNIASVIDYPAEIKDFKILIFFDNSLKHQVVLSRDSNLHIIKNILPGMYTIKLSTGLTLWQKYLISTHVFLVPPAEQTEFKLAAQTTPDRRKPTVEDTIMDRVSVRVFAGVNGGTMEVELL